MVALVNQYGEFVVALEPCDANGDYYQLPLSFEFDYLAIGDTYTVKEI